MSEASLPSILPETQRTNPRVFCPLMHCKTISIDCEATKCVYNSNYKCHAEHVDIKGGGASTISSRLLKLPINHTLLPCLNNALICAVSSMLP